MTARADIVTWLETALTGAGFAFVTRRRLSAGEIAHAQFPAAVVIAGPETCRQISLNAHTVEADWTVDLDLHICDPAGNPQAAWETMAAAAVKAVATDGTLGGKAIMTEVTAKTPDPRVFAPWASGSVRLRIRYRFNELTQGG